MASALAAFRASALAISLGCAALSAAAAPESGGVSLIERGPDEFVLPEDLRARVPDEEAWRTHAGRYERQGDETRIGLLLPAPTTATWRLRLADRAELRFAQTLLSPEGATPADHWLEVEVDPAEGEPVRFEALLRGEAFEDRAIDLSRWSGQFVTLRLTTRSERPSARSLPFVAHPFLATPRSDTRRVVLIFIDTLRRDHVGAYGYAQQTTPRIDALAEASVVFDDARSVAPWTLPSARSALTGFLPDRYDAVVPLPERLRRRGWATAMFSANIYLDERFAMQRGWEHLRSVIGESAERQTEHALTWLRTRHDRDALLLVHYMDPHLPYSEPELHRDARAKGPVPAPLAEDFSVRGDVLGLPRPVPDEVRDYLVARYDANIRYTDHEVGRLLDALDDDDVVVLFSDHGEEFFEHGSFEHGHSLYEELLRIPLLLRAPALDRARVSEPVSLIDLAPTVLELLGLPHEDMQGRSLLPLARDEAASRSAFAERALGFGWPLYGSEAWGLLRGAQKWTTSAGRVTHFALDNDPQERANLASVAAASASLAEPLSQALRRELRSVLRLSVSRATRRPGERLVVTLHVPGGIEKSWLGDDPLAHSKVGVVVEGETLRATFRAGARGAREIFVVPSAGASATLGRVRGDAKLGERAATPLVFMSPAFPKPGRALAARTGDRRNVELGLALAPDPRNDDVPLVGDHPELREQLRALGYEAGPDAGPSAEQAP